MCSEVQRCLVVQKLSLVQPQQSIPARQWNGPSDVVLLEKQLASYEIHWDEDQTVLTVYHFIHLTSSHLSFYDVSRLLYVSCVTLHDMDLPSNIVRWIVDRYSTLNHRLNGSSSPVLTATCLSYGSFCDFLVFSPTDLEVTPLYRFWRKMAQTTWIHEHMCLLG